MREELSRVDVAAKAARRGNDRNAALDELCRHKLDKLRTLRNYGFVHGLFQTNGHCLHLAYAHAAIGQKSLKQRDKVLHALVIGFVIHRHAAAARKTELAGGEIDDIGIGAEGARDLADAHVPTGGFTRFDKVQVVLHEACVQHDHDAVCPRNLRHIGHVLQREWLTADEVRTRFYTDKCNVLSAVARDAFVEFIQIDVALEGVVALGIETLVDDDLLDASANARDVRLSGGEVEIHRHHAAGLNERLGNDALAGASLMGGEEIFRAEQLADLGLQTIVGCAAGVAVVRGHHRGCLLVAHGVYTAVGEHVQKDILVAQQKCVVARFGHRLLPRFHRQEVKFLHYAHLVHFKGELLARKEFYFAHSLGFLQYIFVFF